jgi:integration host factor subunit beta
VTKKDIVRTIAEELELPQLRTRQLVQRTFDALIESLAEEGRVELRKFGVFQIKRREARMARNPRTGAQVPVRARNVVVFKPGKEMEARVRSYVPKPPGTAADDPPAVAPDHAHDAQPPAATRRDTEPPNGAPSVG